MKKFMKQRTLSLFGLVALAGMLSAAPQAAAPEKMPAKKEAGKMEAAKTAGSKMATPTTTVDINSATLEELKALPGVGDTYAQKIVDGRPYKGRNELVDKKILPEAIYSKIRTMVRARQPKMAKAAKK